jgi:hypothetical protein
LVPFFENLGISEITAGKIQEYRVHPHQEAIANPRQASGPQHHPPQIVTLRQTLNTALRHGWLDRLPDFSEPYRSSPKISILLRNGFRGSLPQSGFVQRLF